MTFRSDEERRLVLEREGEVHAQWHKLYKLAFETLIAKNGAADPIGTAVEAKALANAAIVPLEEKIDAFTMRYSEIMYGDRR